MKLHTIESRMRGGIKSQTSLKLSAGLAILVGGSAVMRYAAAGWAWWKIALAVVVIVGLVVNAYNTWHSTNDIEEQYAERLRSLWEETYHVVTFANKEEAAAFVAALARQLHAPRADLASFEEDVEIAASHGADGTVLYLSDGAMRAFETAFATPPVTTTMLGKELPADRVPVLVGAPEQPIGMEDAMRRLNGKRSEIVHQHFRLTDPRYMDGMPR